MLSWDLKAEHNIWQFHVKWENGFDYSGRNSLKHITPAIFRNALNVMQQIKSEK